MTLTRRDAMAWTGALGVLPFAGSAAHAAMPQPGAESDQIGEMASTFLDYDPVTNFRQAMRMQRSLNDVDDILHWYHFIMVVVAPGKAPAPVVRWEGIELSRHVRVGENLYRLHGHNLSFPRNLDSGAFTSDALNPATGKMVHPTMLALTGDPGMYFSPKGTLTLDRPDGKFQPKYTKLRREGDLIKVDAIRVPPATWPVTFLEMGYEASPAKLFDDPAQLWLPATVSGAYVFPYPDWMEMGDAPGHMFAAWSGHKLRSVDQLPPEFRAKAEAERPDLLRVDPASFEKQVPLPTAY